MQATSKRRINTSTEFDKYFEKSENKIFVIKKSADLSDTIKHIHKIVQKYYPQSKKIAEVLKGKNVYDTCKNIWNFVYENIQYKLDEDGTEQLRTPNRTWADRFSGVDCDCYSIFISTILVNLKIEHYYRLAEYKNKGHYQHIYIVVPTENSDILIDCVKDKFNTEQPYTNYEDIKNKTKMELQVLAGFGSTSTGEIPTYEDYFELIKNLTLAEFLAFKKNYEKLTSREADLSRSEGDYDILAGNTTAENLDEHIDGLAFIMWKMYDNPSLADVRKQIETAKNNAKGSVASNQNNTNTNAPTQKTFMQKYGLGIAIGVGVLMAGALAISFTGNEQDKPKPKNVNGLAGTKKTNLPKKLKY